MLEVGYPVHAGIDPLTRSRTQRRLRLPRTRGDRPMTCATDSKTMWATPYTRGSTCWEDSQGDFEDGYPVHAGIDRADR